MRPNESDRHTQEDNTKRNLQETGVTVQTTHMWLRIWSRSRLTHEHSNKPLDPMTCKVFLDQVSVHQLLKEDFTS
jgi:hypothetical protein